MHEVDMTKCLLLSMNQWRQQHDPAVPRVSQVHLQVGDFTCVEPEQLVHTWRIAVQNSWLAGAELAIEHVPLMGRCVCCNATYLAVAGNGLSLALLRSPDGGDRVRTGTADPFR
jgi:hydrogenase nickel incorporation protein HypA/HybF